MFGIMWSSVEMCFNTYNFCSRSVLSRERKIRFLGAIRHVFSELKSIRGEDFSRSTPHQKCIALKACL